MWCAEWELKMKFIIQDWAGNRIDRKEWPTRWDSFEDAEYDLAVWLADTYETDRQEYYIVETE